MNGRRRRVMLTGVLAYKALLRTAAKPHRLSHPRESGSAETLDIDTFMVFLRLRHLRLAHDFARWMKTLKGMAAFIKGLEISSGSLLISAYI
jgi:hypothetical protein